MKIFSISAFIFFLMLTACNAQEIVIGMGEGDSPPYYFMKNNKLAGICPDVITEAARLVGITARFESYPWKRMMFYVEAGKIDGVMPVYKTPEREAILYYVAEPLVFDPFTFFTSKDSPVTRYSGSIDDFKDHTIGVISGFSYGKEFDRADYIQKEPARNEKNLIDKFIAGRFEIGIGNPYVLGYYAEQMGISDRIVFLKPWYSKEPLFLALTKAKGYQELSEKLTKAVQNLKESGMYKKILNKYHVPAELE